MQATHKRSLRAIALEGAVLATSLVASNVMAQAFPAKPI